MRIKSRNTTAAALVAALALFAGACGDSKDSGDNASTGTDSETKTTAPASDACRTLEYEDAPEGGTLEDYAQLSSAGDNTSFDPGAVQTLDESQVTTALFDGLTDFDFTDTCNPTIEPLVAEKWEANDDATEYTFTIKKDQVFSNGEPVLPSSFKRGWERSGSAELASSYGYLLAYVKDGDKLLDGSMTTLDSIVADDDAMTLKVTLADSNADFPAIVSFPAFSPITKEDFTRVGNTTGWGTKGVTIGNGPFKLESAESPDTGTVVLVRNDTWAGNIFGDKKAKLDKIVFHLTSEVEASFQAFEAGEGDTATIPSGQFGPAMEQYPNTVDSAMLGTYFFDFGHDDSNVGGEKNVKLRAAISMAIDRDEINAKVYEGTRFISTGITPPGIPGFESNLCKYCAYDPTEAKKLFKEWEADGGKIEGDIKISINSGGGHEDVAAIIQNNVKDTLGISLKIDAIEEDYFKVIAKEGACQICRSGWYADYPTYGNFMVDLFGAVSIDGNNLGRYDDEKFESLIADAQKETDDTKRGELYASAEKRLLNETVNAIPINWYTGDHVYRDSVVNYVQPPLGIFLWEKVGKNG
ncbi:MAG: peptide ABC transporter substrate-binding protein [Actinobacteria bacterium]|nr:peptide ABC transporter substrate-binding protein [Actinomycetota bacterium]